MKATYSVWGSLDQFNSCFRLNLAPSLAAADEMAKKEASHNSAWPRIVFEQIGRNPPEPVAIWERSA